MKRLMLTIVAALLFLVGLAARADRFVPAKGSSVKIAGTSTMHDWSMEGTTIEGRIDVSTPDARPNVVVTIPVTSIRSEHAKMDKLMAEALKAGQHPEVRFELTQTTPRQPDAATFVLKTRGRLTIAGVTREIALEVKGTRGADGRYTLTGEAPIRMTDFGVKPPTAMFNTIRTGDDVKVTFCWIVEKAD